uniref:Uncharacterized protein n=1 Tax=Caenorhabditis tropicalis TaxID=1561998 RepID=A0A1I7TLV0_9PELO
MHIVEEIATNGPVVQKLRVAEANYWSRVVVQDNEFTTIMITDNFPSVLNRFYGHKINAQFVSREFYYRPMLFTNQKFLHHHHDGIDLFIEINPDNEDGQKNAMKHIFKHIVKNHKSHFTRY